MNDIGINEIPNSSLLLIYNGLPEGHTLKNDYYREICNRIVNWRGVSLPHNHVPRRVILDLFRRHMNDNEIEIKRIKQNHFEDELFKV